MRRVVCGLGLLVAACQQQPDDGNVPAADNRIAGGVPEVVPPRTGEAANEPETASSGAEEDRLGSLPPPNADPRFIGRWAAQASYCADKAWRFTATSLDTPAGSQCRFTDVRRVPGGYDIAARCTSEGPETADRITLRFAESARAMLFESEVIADVGLVYCGK